MRNLPTGTKFAYSVANWSDLLPRNQKYYTAAFLVKNRLPFAAEMLMTVSLNSRQIRVWVAIQVLCQLVTYPY